MKYEWSRADWVGPEALRFAPQEARLLRIGRALPVREGALEVLP
jgi:hypothetical protein